MWIGEYGCENIVREIWHPGSARSNIGEVMDLISRCSQKLEVGIEQGLVMFNINYTRQKKDYKKYKREILLGPLE